RMIVEAAGERKVASRCTRVSAAVHSVFSCAGIGHPDLVIPVEPEAMEADSAGGGDVGRAEATAENLVAISRSLRPRSGAGTHPAGDGGVRTSLADDGFVPPSATEDGRDDTSSVGDVRVDAFSTGAVLRAWEDIRAEEFHVEVVCASEEVAAEQARALARTRCELGQARREHREAVSEPATLQEMSEERLRQVEGTRRQASSLPRRPRTGFGPTTSARGWGRTLGCGRAEPELSSDGDLAQRIDLRLLARH